jgi:hypothetical protein
MKLILSLLKNRLKILTLFPVFFYQPFRLIRKFREFAADFKDCIVFCFIELLQYFHDNFYVLFLYFICDFFRRIFLYTVYNAVNPVSQCHISRS